MKKQERQKIIRQLILEQPISTQEELLEHLQKAGISATQATISRDIREMNIIKSHDANKNVRYTLFTHAPISTNEQKLRASVRRDVLRIQQVQFMIVVLTEKNGADIVTNWLDEIKYPEVVATVAGVDTFIIICRTEKEAQLFAEKLERMRD
ncbi:MULTISPECIES: arginine repressor [unclassified Enterococcus]|jgi:transcriptional regulator of arginine metabolism|uniref:arginine repressor n=1 Tax=unclassified Enterococcus TaxID=2608891 RepID=UPI0003547EFC|nr:arginine repressor protein [Enterococcus faecalis 13-SD-W-01]